ncbi:bifunctional lysylphosphatidylglycerol flippase/synthetase MprF [Lactococcus nasutitermitis]|uniref:Bifunctional lysylphosphatidylglycerol flippase/synthetase MprF n=1 Tax=Lactococcus nasutitermitis TaxID=1652957 RepID=A0ABV9JF74_9LACT|nr:DUF2156 domain-containing protein [Lactococcus nasutitermitis]
MYRVKRSAQNLAIGLSLLISLANVVGFYVWRLHPFGWHRTMAFYDYVAPYGLMTHRVLAFTVGFLGFWVSFRLFRRLRSAWVLTMIGQSMLFVLHFYYSGQIFSVSSLISLYILLVLGVTFQDFRRVSETATRSRAIILACIPLALAIINAALSVWFLPGYIGTRNFMGALNHSFRFLLLMNTSGADFARHDNFLYIVSLIAVSWVCLIIALILFLKPLIISPIVSSLDRKRVLNLVEKYGQNPMAYMALMRDKHYFFGEMVNGVIAYTIVNNVLVVAGDIICAPEDAVKFMGEVQRFTYKNDWKLLFVDITDVLRETYEAYGLNVVKVGEDACIRLEDYNLKGKKAAKVRANINHARRLGVSVAEYKPLVQRDLVIEHEMNDISREWFKEKGAEMGFMLGGLELANPLNRRYFYAKDGEGKMLAFVVFIPYDAGNAYMADVTRRRSAAPNGTMEVIMFDAFTVMRDEGVTWGNLGLCPLANVKSEESSSMTAPIFEFVFENLNGIYGFKGLYQAKKKFAPTDWQARYVAYAPKPFGASYAYALIKAQNPKGIDRLILEKLRGRFGR